MIGGKCATGVIVKFRRGPHSKLPRSCGVRRVGGSSFKPSASPWRVHPCVEVDGESESIGQWVVVVVVLGR